MVHLGPEMNERVDADRPSDGVSRSPRLAGLRHPLVVGALLAVLTALIASVLVPALTRSWQDRPRELALKRGLVARIARATATTLEGGRQFGDTVRERDVRPTSKPAPLSYAKRVDFIQRGQYAWGVESSVIASELGTYFHQTELRERWREFDDAVRRFLRYAAVRYPEDDPYFYALLVEHFRDRTPMFQDARAERIRKRFISEANYEGEGDIAGRHQLNDVTTLLFYESERIQDELVESNASGFSHGFWIFG
jgi:hypothetical protein